MSLAWSFSANVLRGLMRKQFAGQELLEPRVVDPCRPTDTNGLTLGSVLTILKFAQSRHYSRFTISEFLLSRITRDHDLPSHLLLILARTFPRFVCRRLWNGLHELLLCGGGR